MCGPANSVYHEVSYEKNLNNTSLIRNYLYILSHFDRFCLDVLCPGLEAHRIITYSSLRRHRNKNEYLRFNRNSLRTATMNPASEYNMFIVSPKNNMSAFLRKAETSIREVKTFS